MNIIRRYKPRKVRVFNWSAELAYAVGLIVTDGCLPRKKQLYKDYIENLNKTPAQKSGVKNG